MPIRIPEDAEDTVRSWLNSGNKWNSVEVVIARLSPHDLDDLCRSTVDAIEAGGGFGWLKPPSLDVLEDYWRGVEINPYRALFVTRLDGIICGSAQLVRPFPNNEARAHVATVTANFIASSARGRGLASALMDAIETQASLEGFEYISLDVRETQNRAIDLYTGRGYAQWGCNPAYARVDEKNVKGLYFQKAL